MPLQRMSITVSQRLMVVSAVFIAALLVVGATGLAMMIRLGDANARLVDHDLAQMGRLSAARADIANMRRFEKDMLIGVGRADVVAKYLADWQARGSRVAGLLAAARQAAAASGDTGTVEAVGAITGAFDDYRTRMQALAEQLGGTAYADAAAANRAVSKDGIRRTDELLDRLIEQLEAAATASDVALRATNARAQALLVGCIVLAVIIGALVARWIARSIVRGLHYVRRRAMRMADGDLTEQTERRTGPPGRDELSQLVSAVQAMQDHLVNLVRTVQASAAGVASASSQIAQGNGDLSSRTERQAAGIEQTGATIAELSGTVEQNSRDTREADALARTAREVAAAGGTLMEGVVATMQGIQGGAQRIAEITGVIDGIAFQTNILALNAAVEAARAGAEGRGFAVVATEVRALAQRSAQAAREIKSLIAASVEQVGDGARQVGEAGETMTRIVASIGRVSELVGDIATSAQAQAEGLAQVRSAVQDIESATQQNAALVEESAAAAASLAGQAQDLLTAAQRFRLAEA